MIKETLIKVINDIHMYTQCKNGAKAVNNIVIYNISIYTNIQNRKALHLVPWSQYQKSFSMI